MYPIPENEAARLATLRAYQVLDTPAEPEFDELVQLAAHICEVPISLVSLIDVERQWFKASYGLDATQTPREHAFCAHAILQPEIMEIPDARQDSRFADNPLVTQAPQIRFYAGMPLISPQGYSLGTLCVIDTKPHTLSLLQKQTLRTLARQVIQLPELRRFSRLQARQYEQVERTRRCQNALNLLTYEANLSLSDILREAADILLTYSEMDGARIYALQGDQVQTLAALEAPNHDDTDRMYLPDQHPLAGSYAEVIVASETVLAWEDLESGHPARQQLETVFGIRNLLGASYRVEGQIAGIVTCYSRVSASEPFTPLQREFLQMFSSWMGSTLERHAFLAKQQELQEIYQLALTSADAGLWVIPDFTRDEMWWSERAYSHLGYTPDDLQISRSQIRELLHSEDVTRVAEAMTKAPQADEPFRMELRLRCKDNHFKWLELQGLVCKRKEDVGLRLVGVIRDIDAERLLLEQLTKSEQMLQKMGRLARIGVWKLDLSTQKLEWSEEMFRIYEVDLTQSPPSLDEALAFYSPEEQAGIQAAMQEGIRSGQEWERDLPAITAKGLEIWTRNISQAAYRNGVPNHLWGAVLDITHRKLPRLQHQRMQAFQHRLAGLSYDLSLSREAVLQQALELALEFYHLPTGVITQVRGDVFEILAWKDETNSQTQPPFLPGTPMALKGSFTEWLVQHEQVLSLDEILASDNKAYQSISHRFQICTLIGKAFRVQGEVFGQVACYGPDERKEPYTDFEREFMEHFSRWLGFMLERSRFIEHLHQLNEAQNSMLAVVAHDLRNPLSAIQSAKWLIDRQMRKGQPPDERFLTVIENSCVHANGLIAELLEVAELEQSRHQLKLEAGSFCQLLNQILETFAIHAQEKQLNLVWQPPEQDCLIAMNPPKMSRAIKNLLHNALKFTPSHGTITLTLLCQDRQVMLTVADTGIGIPNELQAILFDKFTKAGRPGTQGERSNGLGMHITREIVKMHGGQIQLSSKVGVGSQFTIQVPRLQNLVLEST